RIVRAALCAGVPAIDRLASASLASEIQGGSRQGPSEAAWAIPCGDGTCVRIRRPEPLHSRVHGNHRDAAWGMAALARRSGRGSARAGGQPKAGRTKRKCVIFFLNLTTTPLSPAANFGDR